MIDSQKIQANTEWDRLIERLNRAGVPPDPRWRTLVLYMRNMGTFDFLTEKQKAQMQQLIVKTLESKDYSQAQYLKIIRQQEDILLGPYKENIQMALEESKALLEDVRHLLQRKKGDVQNLEVTTVDLVEQGTDPKELISSMRKAFHEVVNDMEQDMKNLTHLSLTDQLTQLNNRRAFDDLLQKSVEESLRDGTPLSLLMIDIDHFKRFNDNYGHHVGDQALQIMGRTLKMIGERVDAEGGNYHPCRYGGEEFTVILPHTDMALAEQVAEMIRKQLEKSRFNIQDKKGALLHQGLGITVSLGVQELDPLWEVDHAARLVEGADRKLYCAKESGRNQVCGTLKA